MRLTPNHRKICVIASKTAAAVTVTGGPETTTTTTTTVLSPANPAPAPALALATHHLASPGAVGPTNAQLVLPDGTYTLKGGAKITLKNRVLTEVALQGATEITIPDGVTSIGVWANINRIPLTSITLPQSLKKIRMGAFT